MILETPASIPAVWAQEIDLLYTMVGKGPGDAELERREAELQHMGMEDRKKQLEVLGRRGERKGKKGGKKKGERDDGGSSCGEVDE